MTDMIEIDGSMGEGGGQVLRTALGLSLVTGRPFRIDHIRASRKKPGLLRQHLTCVKAAARIGAAEVVGGEIASTTLTFCPQDILPGNYEFAIGSAGSTTLVLQSVLPALIVAEKPSVVTIRGGTHNPMAPTFDFLERIFFNVLRGMGVGIAAKIHSHGFFPVGGGSIEIEITPTSCLLPFEILERGPLVNRRATILTSGLGRSIAEREKDVLRKRLNWPGIDDCIVDVGGSPSPGNVVMLEVSDGQCREMVTSTARRGKSAEIVAKEACSSLQSYLRSTAPVGAHLADQLLIPMAMAAGGSFCCRHLSLHARTNADVIEKFLDVSFSFVEEEKRRVRIELSS